MTKAQWEVFGSLTLKKLTGQISQEEEIELQALRDFVASEPIPLEQKVAEFQSFESSEIEVLQKQVELLQFALREFFSEFDSQRSQFGDDFIWKKYEDKRLLKILRELASLPPYEFN